MNYSADFSVAKAISSMLSPDGTAEYAGHFSFLLPPKSPHELKDTLKATATARHMNNFLIDFVLYLVTVKIRLKR